MGIENKNKLNHLITNWKHGTVALASYLNEQGYSSGLLQKYKKSCWLHSPVLTIYTLFGDQIDWQGGLYAIQKQQKLDIHIGGKTALEIKGYGHNLGTELNRVFLYSENLNKLPLWFKKLNWGVRIIYTAKNLFSTTPKYSFSELQHKEFSLKISSPERAVIEMLYNVPDKVNFNEAEEIMKNLAGLRPSITQKLLLNCKSVKVKRLFMYMAEKANHDWFNKIDKTRIDLGKGKRQIIKGGTFNNKYNITVLKSNKEDSLF